MKIPILLLIILVTGASLAAASFEFLDTKRKFIQERDYVQKYGEIELPTFFFPINKPSEAGTAIPKPAAHHNERDQKSQPPPSTTQGVEPVAPLPLSISKVPSLLTAVYLFSSVCFILCLRGLSTPTTAKRGNILGMVGMAAAIIVTFTEQGFDTHYLAFALTVLPAGAIGIYVAQYVSMLEIPELVATFHSFVGVAAMLVGFSTFHSPTLHEGTEQLAHLIEIYIGEFIAAITFTGSIVAALKLHETMDSRALRLPRRHTINGGIASVIVFLSLVFCFANDFVTQVAALYTSVALSLFLGYHLVASIGGADMPVVVSMLNSYSGFATAASGFMLDNNLLIIAGSLIGSSGAILSYIMCRGMNRDILNVILGGWEEEGIEGIDGQEGIVRETTADAVAEIMINSKNIVIVPGYGMAVSRCQAELSKISLMLRARGIRVRFAIHPVAGRMPGHMNVLLAEADVPYSMVKEMDEINFDMPDVDMVLVVGANDTVNPASMDPNSKIAGMPVIEVWKAKRVVVLKRSMGRGYAAIENPLFFMENTKMLFGDAKVSTAGIHARIYQRVGLMDASDSQLNLERTAWEKAQLCEETFLEPKMVIGVVKDSNGGTTMVPMAPRFIPKLKRMAFKVLVQEGSGLESNFTDEMYREQGAVVLSSLDDIIQTSHVILKVSVPSEEFILQIPPKKVLISYVWPARNTHILNTLVRRDITALAVDEVPRVTRAQKCDVRSSMGTLQGYRAVVEAFSRLPRLSKASITAAGRIEAAKVFVIGAGVAGLQAISTAHGLGADVTAHDTRTATKEEVESLGGKFCTVSVEEEGEAAGGYAREMGEAYKRAQEKLYRDIVKNADVVICTAAIPGKPSPKLISETMVKSMKPGSVIVDLATEFGDRDNNWGGNCQLSLRNDDVIAHGVTILGRDKMETRMSTQASELFSMNILNILEELGEGNNFDINLDNDVIRGLVVAHNGRSMWEAPELHSPPLEPQPISVTPKTPKNRGSKFLEQLLLSDVFFAICLFCAAAVIGIIGGIMDTLELQHLFLFVLALIVGYYCVWSVTPALHTPLMSVTNALSGVILIGSMVEYDGALDQGYALCALVATFLSALNIAGGFCVTRRMIGMFII